MTRLISMVAASMIATAASAQPSTTSRDASGRATGTVTTDSNGTKTFRDGAGVGIGRQVASHASKQGMQIRFAMHYA